MAENMYENMIDISGVPCAAIVFRFDGNSFRLNCANSKFFSLLSYNKSEYLELTPNETGFRIIGREYGAYLIDKIDTLVKNCNDFAIELEATDAHGEKIMLYAEINSVRDGNEYILTCFLHKMSDVAAAAHVGTDMDSMMLEVMSISADLIFRYSDAEDKFDIYRNIGGNFAEQTSITDFEGYFRANGCVYEEDIETFDQFCTNVKSGIDRGVFELRLMIEPDRTHKWYRITVKTIRDKISNAYVGAVGKIEDISGMKNANQRLIEKAERDPLTKLYNKATTKEMIKNYLRTDSRDTYDAFIIVDVDNFKQVNDTLGHLFGDSVLVDLAQEMQDLFRSNDVIGRIGGDEFIVFLRGLKQISHIESKADDLCKIFRLIYSDDDGLNISGSLGISLFPQDGDTFDELYRKADIALYNSKRAGKSCYHFYKSGEEHTQEEVKSIPRVERYLSSMDFLHSGMGFENEILNSAFEMVECGGDINDTISNLLAKVGKHFNFSRIVVNEAFDDSRVFKSTYCWRTKKTEPILSDSLALSVKELNDFCSGFDKNFIYNYNAPASVTPGDVISVHMKRNRVKSAIICGYYRGGRLIGTVSFHECTAAYLWSIEEAKSLKELTRVIFSYLIKLRNFDIARETADYSSNYDKLTGLMNFSCFKKHISEYIETAFENDKYIMFISDFANFSYINNKYGYDVGNNLLKSYSNAFQYFSDAVKYVCRVSADKFCAFCEYQDGIIKTFESFIKRFATNEHLIGGNTSFGITTGAYVFDGLSAINFDSVFDNVNLALKYAKNRSVGKCSVYSNDMRDELNRSIEISIDAKKALLNNEFKVYFQPKFSLKSRKIVGAEALVRWVKPNGIIVPPDSFVPLLEKNGFIINIDFYVYEDVCRYLAKRIEEGRPIVPVSVNVSRIHMLMHDFSHKMFEIVKKYKIDPSLIELELTEGIFISDEENAMEVIDKLKSYGFRVSIDDFGSGYSSLSLLKNMPVDVLKIDKEFFNGVPNNGKEEIVLSSMIDMADKMNIDIICEGVETAEQVAFLSNSKCDTVQGYYFAHPIPTRDFDELLDGDK